MEDSAVRLLGGTGGGESGSQEPSPPHFLAKCPVGMGRGRTSSLAHGALGARPSGTGTAGFLLVTWSSGCGGVLPPWLCGWTAAASIHTWTRCRVFNFYYFYFY